MSYRYDRGLSMRSSINQTDSPVPVPRSKTVLAPTAEVHSNTCSETLLRVGWKRIGIKTNERARMRTLLWRRLKAGSPSGI